MAAHIKHLLMRKYNEELDKNFYLWRDYQSNRSLSASQRRITMAKWVNEVWGELMKDSDFLRSAFNSCGATIKLDGTHFTKLRDCPFYSFA